jgi:hypothetical protein
MGNTINLFLFFFFLHPLCIRSCLQCRACDDPGPLCRAAADGNAAVVQMLIDSFGSVITKRRTGTCGSVWKDAQMSPLRATISGSSAAGTAAPSHNQVVTLLIQAKANVDSGDLEEAARVCPSSAIIAALITASVGHLDLTKSLNTAVAYSNAEAVKALLEHNADPNAQRYLLRACYTSGNCRPILLLLLLLLLLL